MTTWGRGAGEEGTGGPGGAVGMGGRRSPGVCLKTDTWRAESGAGAQAGGQP
jgi:hypothetical protein